MTKKELATFILLGTEGILAKYHPHVALFPSIKADPQHCGFRGLCVHSKELGLRGQIGECTREIGHTGPHVACYFGSHDLFGILEPYHD